MTRTTTLAAATVVGVGLVTTSIAFRASSRWLARQQHFDQEEIELRLVIPPATEVGVFRAGTTLAGAERVSAVGDQSWLAAGRYFVEARTSSRTLFFPVPLEATHRGPDSEGSFAITVRTLGTDVPPEREGAGAFALVPSGHFALGERQNPNETHFVWVSSFFIGVFEVTNGEFRRFLRDPNGFDARENWTEEGWRWKEAQPSQATALLSPAHPEYRRFGADDVPVVLVTWHEAHAFGRWLTRTLGGDEWVFRLPTESEWEKAARGPDSFDYALGMQLSEPEASLYNWRKNPDAEVTLVGLGATLSRYRPNRYGLYHVSGNAAEWTASIARPYNRDVVYEDDNRNDPTATGSRITRGGSWYSATTSRLRVAYREDFAPNLSSNDLGFRIVAARLPSAPRRD